MEKDRQTGEMGRNFVRRLCFIAIGISAFSDPMERLNPYDMIFGALAGLLFGWLFRKFLRSFLSLFNGKFKKKNGKEPIRDAVDSGMLFCFPSRSCCCLPSIILIGRRHEDLLRQVLWR